MKLLNTLIFLILVLPLSAQTKKKFSSYEDTIPGSEITFKMIAVKAGKFLMGSDEKSPFHKPDEGPQKKVKIAAFWIGEHEVTYDEFLLFSNDRSASINSEVDAVTRPTAQYIDLSWGMGKEGGFPVNSMSQMTALMYCKWLYKKTGIFYRLPTEAEWEYACRAGNSSEYYFGDDSAAIGDYAWYIGNSGKKYHLVKQKKPNAWGLYDMLGNVAEWTLDQYDSSYFKNIGDHPDNPLIPPGSRYPKTVRGGGYRDRAVALRCANRHKSDASWNRRDPQLPKSKWWLTDAMAVGFRLVAPLKQPAAEEAEAFYAKYILMH